MQMNNIFIVVSMYVRNWAVILTLFVMFYLHGFCYLFVLEAKGSGTPRLASKFHKTHKEWLPQKVSTITRYFSSE
jgi:hypothetical protein